MTSTSPCAQKHKDTSAGKSIETALETHRRSAAFSRSWKAKTRPRSCHPRPDRGSIRFQSCGKGPAPSGCSATMTCRLSCASKTEPAKPEPNENACPRVQKKLEDGGSTRPGLKRGRRSKPSPLKSVIVASAVGVFGRKTDVRCTGTE